MRPTSWKALTVLASLVAPFTQAQQCGMILDTAKSVTNRLQSHYYSSASGQYNGGSLWTDANTIEDIHNLMLATGTNEWSTLADNSYIGRSALNANTNWNAILNGSNDDAGWIILALWKVADYKSSRGQDNSAYMRAAQSIYDIIKNQWDGTCGGGLWWSSAHTYKNAITNELFLFVSAAGYIRTKKQEFLDNAKKTSSWLLNSGMRNADGLWNDGLDLNGCRNNGQTTWTYNQGVIASGLAALYSITGDKSLLDQAEITLDATIRRLSNNNILRESCDNTASGQGSCNQDQQIFKGIWTKHLQFYLDNANDPARTAKYAGFLHSQYSAVLHYGTNGDGDIGSVWYGPNQGGSVFSPKTSSSGLAAHVAAAKYGTCAP
ncbi:glycoside hydrolase family 76 protein [Crepidotus variabilis]|uniref:Glycoside hydrolase family 76 protein n=1 Tax=Crepidotus variabilis TaxID=179855 RepID=A0A9P6JT65_9AGAR|nr:glycoside hydrolase family 76 protein [Crepidotus variabilis]